MLILMTNSSVFHHVSFLSPLLFYCCVLCSLSFSVQLSKAVLYIPGCPVRMFSSIIFVYQKCVISIGSARCLFLFNFQNVLCFSFEGIGGCMMYSVCHSHCLFLLFLLFNIFGSSPQFTYKPANQTNSAYQENSFFCFTKLFATLT